MEITIFLKDGTKKFWAEESRPGGSYTNSIKYEVGFVIVTDTWGKMTAIPTNDVKEIIADPHLGNRW